MNQYIKVCLAMQDYHDVVKETKQNWHILWLFVFWGELSLYTMEERETLLSSEFFG